MTSRGPFRPKTFYDSTIQVFLTVPAKSKNSHVNVIVCIGNKYSKYIYSKYKIFVQLNIMHWQL